MSDFEPTARTRMRHCAHKARYDRDTVYQIIDDIPECTIAVCEPQTGLPRQMVSTHWRIDDALYIHGSNGSGFCKLLAAGVPAAVSIAATDGLVLARSAFDTSINFRSVSVYGQFEAVRARDEQLALLQGFYEKLVPGRWEEVRAPTPQELAATFVLRLPLSEAVAKVSEGEPDDQAEAPDVWGGVRVYRHGWGELVADGASGDKPLPASLRRLLER
ncbi:MAG: pyridoxamine 5'-phosphate oxidase family protein [Paludibacterium sp.]|uniref:pyridoxamine 5'-phosphate oxidase family protein n=1 Tax=Paludibacterium sp. TaxID=1917523 RepID=UPI0025ED0915|nr:pyridoxamine 5'-phosphate oxidase family protein [Paludibacterium sp.]MBV8047125.1 pyridoxamine 5'-phosphate oxidase family protein [Paludibacterium sp.]